MPDPSVPDPSVPDPSVPDPSVPDPSVPDPSVPDPFVPDGFEAPRGLITEHLVLEPLTPDHNVSDHDAWTSSIAHIKATPGFADRDWPSGYLSLEENRADLEQHADDFRTRTGFTFTVLERNSREVIGCVYFYPPRRRGFDVDVSSWVRKSHAAVDPRLFEAVTMWLAVAWPWHSSDYAARPASSPA